MAGQNIAGVILLVSALMYVEALPKYVSCPASDPADHVVFYPHEANCTEYYMCDHGRAILDICPSGLHWNAELEVCDYPWHARCSRSEEVLDNVGETVDSGCKDGSSGTTSVCPAGLAPACPSSESAYRQVTFFNHASDCHWYYQCNNGVATCRQCPNGLYWNSRLNTCDWPWQSDCSGTSGGDSGGKHETGNSGSVSGSCPVPQPIHPVYFSDPYDCSAFYECSYGIAYKLKCPSGLAFNTKLNVCDEPEIVGCKGVNNETGSENERPPTDNKPPTVEQPDKPHIPDVTSVCPATEAPACPAQDPRMAVLLAHPTSCSWYFECSNGIPYCMPCPAGEHFNPKLNVCDYPEHAGCGAADVIPEDNKEPPKEEKPPKEDTIPYPIGPNPEPPTNIVNVCPAAEAPACPAQDPRMAVLLAHPTSCSWYFECSNGIPYCMPCPAGEHFNPKLKVCDYPEHAGCGAADVIPEDNKEPPKEEKPPKEDTIPYPIGPNPEPPTNIVNVCPAAEAPACPAQDPRMAVLLAHPTSCSWYFECSNGIPYCMPCPAGEHFNPKLKVCDYPEHAGCGSADVIPKDNEEPPKEEKIPEIEIRPLPITLPVEPKPEVPANVVKNVCPAVEAPACPAQDPRMAVLLAHPTSCSWYFECSNGIPYCMPCPAGEHFNPKLKVCDYPEHAGCGSADVIPKDNEEPPKEEKIPEIEIRPLPITLPVEPKPEVPANVVKNVCPAVEAPACPAQDPRMAVLLPHPTSCEWYFECSDGIPYCMPCPAGLFFNPKLKVCDYARNAGCNIVN